MVKRTFAPGFRIELHQKDLNLALASGRQMGVSLPNTATAQELFNACVANGHGKLDHSALVKAHSYRWPIMRLDKTRRVNPMTPEATRSVLAVHV